MAKSLKEGVLGLFTGKVGDFVIKRVYGKLVLTKKPVFTKPRSKKQLAQEVRFKQANDYAKMATRVSPTREIYAKLAKKKVGWTASNMAISDYHHAPEIKAVDLAAYNGRAGDSLTIVAYDRVHVAKVVVSIVDHEGNQLESGEATRRPVNRWLYTATENATSGEVTVVVTVNDLPGNTVKTSSTKTID